MYKKYSILNDKIVEGVCKLERSDRDSSYQGIFSLYKDEKSNKIKSKTLTFNFMDKEDIKDFLHFEPEYATSAVEIPFKIADLYRISFVDVAKAIILALIFTLFMFIATVVLKPFVDLGTVSLGDYVAASDIIFLILIGIKKFKAPKIYDKALNMQDNFNSLKEYYNMIKVYLEIKKDILSMSPFIGGMVNTLKLVSTKEDFNKLKEKSHSQWRELFNKPVSIDDLNYSTEVVSSGNTLFVYIKEINNDDLEGEHIIFNKATDILKNDTISKCLRVKVNLKDNEIVTI